MVQDMKKKAIHKKNHGCHPEHEIQTKPPLKIWEMEHCFKCPVIGMCLTRAEQKRLLKKTDFQVKKASDFEMHEVLVASTEDENHLSRRIGNLLHRKLGKKVESLLGLESDQFMIRFKKAFETGEYRVHLWATAIHPELPMDLKKEIFGDIHMSMHWSGEQRIKLKSDLSRKEVDLNRMRQDFKDFKRRNRLLQKEKKQLKQESVSLRARLNAVERKHKQLAGETLSGEVNDRIAELEEKNRTLEKELDTLSRALNERKHMIDPLKNETIRLMAELDAQRELNRRYRKETRTIIKEVMDLNRCDTACPSFDLCEKRVLIVGGMSRMEALYRELIENSGGVFEYHDGYMKKGVKRLESRLKRADVVLCPVNCNSHAACSIVKNLAKKHNKTLHMLANSSLSTVSRIVWGTADKARGTIN